MNKLVKAILWLVAGALCALAALVGFGMWANARAVERATDLCSHIQAGTSGQAALELGRSRASRQLAAPADELRFFFQGWVFNGAICIVKLQAGAVAATRVEVPDD